MLFCRHYYSPLNTFMRKGKDPEPERDPYICLMDPDPDPGGPKTCGSRGSWFGSVFGSSTLLQNQPLFTLYHRSLSCCDGEQELCSSLIIIQRGNLPSGPPLCLDTCSSCRYAVVFLSFLLAILFVFGIFCACSVDCTLYNVHCKLYICLKFI